MKTGPYHRRIIMCGHWVGAAFWSDLGACRKHSDRAGSDEIRGEREHITHSPPYCPARPEQKRKNYRALPGELENFIERAAVWSRCGIRTARPLF
jgi:hypothetical protein